MNKYHINDRGEAKICSAKPGKCRFGDSLAHYSTPAEARSWFENFMKSEVVVPLTRFRFKNTSWNEIPWEVRKSNLVNYGNLIAKKEKLGDPKFRWTNHIDGLGGLIIHAQTRWNGPRADGKLRGIWLTEGMEAFSEETCRIIILHELLHLKGFGHGSKVEEEIFFRELELFVRKYEPSITRNLESDSVTEEDLNRLVSRQQIFFADAHIYQCVNGCSGYQYFRPPARAPCPRCRTYETIWKTVKKEKGV